MTKGHDHLLKFTQPNGSIYVPGKGLANYNTALSMMAMLASGDAKYNPTVIKARQFLVRQQWDLGVKGKTDHPLDGGVGYGNSYPHGDLNNTLTALEAIYYSRHLVKDTRRPRMISTGRRPFRLSKTAKISVRTTSNLG